MAFQAVKAALVVSGRPSLLCISGAQSRKTLNSSSKFCTFLASRSSSGGGRIASSITCADFCLGKRWSLQGLGFRLNVAQTWINGGDRRGFAQARARRGGAAAVASRRTTGPRSVSAKVADLKGEAAAAVNEDQELEEEEEWKSRNQSKRDAKRAKKWGHELASLAPAQLKQAVRWAGLSQDVYDAVMIVKNLGTNSRVRNGRRRQYNFIGGLLRNVDPNVMEPVLKATRDGDVEGIIINSPVLPDPEDLDDKESWAEEDEDEDEEEEEDEDGLHEIVAEEWLHGLVNGISSIEEEVYSMYDVDYDRQELRKLVRGALRSTVAEPSATSEPAKEDGLDSNASLSTKETKSQEMLRKFLTNIAKQRAESRKTFIVID